MTENNKKDPGIAEKAYNKAAEKLASVEKGARWTLEKLNAGLRKVGIREIDINPIIEGIKSGEISPAAVTGFAEEMLKAAAGTLKTVGGWAKNIPYVGKVISGLLKFAGKGFTIASHLVDRVKDACIDLAISSLNRKVGDLRSDLDGTNEKLDKQGKAMADGFNRVEGKLQGLKSDLEGQLSAHGEQIGNLQTQTNRLDSALNNLSQAHSEFKQEVHEQFEEVNERIDSAEVKITKNARDILEEKLEREAIDNELRDKIKENKLQLNNLREEQEEFREDFQRYQTKTDRKLDEVRQEIEDTQEEFQQQLKIQETKIQLEFEETREEFERANNLINTKINQTQEILEEYEEAVGNIKHDQKRLNVEFQELTDDVETQFELIHQQTRKLDLVADQMGEIAEETNRRMDKLESTIFDIEEQAEEAVSIARKATRQVNKLTEDLQKERKRIKDLEEQIKQNKAETKQAKAEAERANERIDNLLKLQQLTDFTKEELAFAKMEKALQLKAEETKLLAQLNILQTTQKIIPEKPAEREWKVGVQKGTEKEMPRPEGFPLSPNSRWREEYTEEELREWGWDTRIKADHESAPLTDLDKRKPEKTTTATAQSEQTAPENTEISQLRKQVEDAKSQILEQIKEIQEQVNENITPLEHASQSEASDSEEEEETPTQLLEQQEKELRTASTQAKVQLAREQRIQQNTKKEITQLKSAITKEQNKLKKNEQALAKENKPTQKKELQKSQAESQQKLTQFQQQLQEKQAQFNQQQQQIEQTQEQVQELNQQIQAAQTQRQTAQQKEFQKEIEQQQTKTAQFQQEILQQQWQQIQQAQQQVIEEQKESEESPPDEQAEKEAQEQAEAEQEVKELEAEAAATQNQMTWMMLLLIIFLLEYIVYKRNGLPGLVVLNIALAIAYYNKDKILEYQHLWNDYVLIIGYITGNVLTYNAVQKPEHKWPSVAGYNAIILAICAYTKWQTYQAQQKLEAKQKQVAQKTTQRELNKNQIEEKELPVKFYNWEEKIEDKPLEQATKFQQELAQAIQAKIEEKKQAEYIQQQEQIVQEQERIAQELAEQQERVKQSLAESQQVSRATSTVNVEGLEQRFPGFQAEYQRVKNWLYSILPASQKTDNLTTVIKEIKLTAEEQNILSKLYLTEDQTIAIALQNKKVKHHEGELRANYAKLTPEQQLKLLNAGLEALGLKTLENKQNLVKVHRQILTEKQDFDLTYEEKEDTLRFFITSLSLTNEQQNELESMGIALFNAANWKTTPEHRATLLKIGLEKVKLNEEEKQNISKPKVKLSARNENILKTLAPLQQEYKYSPDLLNSIRSLKLKYDSLSFLVQQQIIPDLHTQFGEPKDPYKFLKQQVIAQEQKKLFKQEQEEERAKSQQRIQESRESLLPTLLDFGQNNPEGVIELELPIYRERITYYEEKGITRGIENQELTWVALGAINQAHSTLLLMNGFKSARKYGYFELLLFAWENSKSQEELLVNWERWKNISPEFTRELIQEWRAQGFTYEETKDWINIGLQLQDAAYATWLRDIKQTDSDWVLNYGNEKELRQEYQQSHLSAKKPLPKFTWKQFLLEYYWLKNAWEKYLAYQAEKLQSQLEKNRQELAEREEIAQELEAKPINLAELIPSLARYVEEKIQENVNKASSFAFSRESTETHKTTSDQPQTNPDQKPDQPASRYDDLLNNLSQEEAARQKKKLQREAARKKLDSLEFNRREQNLDAKQQKIKAEEERRQREKELEEQELAARKQAFEARQRELKEQEERRLTSQAEQIETKKKMAEEALAIKQKEAELAEQRKRAEIEKIEKENQAEQERLEARAKLIEEEMQKRLAQIALEDQESRQRIEKECQERKAQLEREVLELKRKNERDLMLKKQELEKEKQEKDAQIEHLRKEADLAAKNYREMQNKIAEEQEAAEKLGETTSKAREQKLAAGAVHKKALAAVYEYYLDGDEIQSCCSGVSYSVGPGDILPSVRKLFDQFPGMRINLFNAKVMSSGEAGEKVSVSTGAKFYYWNASDLTTLINKCLGNGSYSKEGLEAKIKSISDPNFFN